MTEPGTDETCLAEALLCAADAFEADSDSADEQPEDVMSQEDAVRWQSARTLADLGALTADWLGGKIGSCPRTPLNVAPTRRPLT
jgi:hypothetical protein